MTIYGIDGHIWYALTTVPRGGRARHRLSPRRPTSCGAPTACGCSPRTTAGSTFAAVDHWHAECVGWHPAARGGARAAPARASPATPASGQPGCRRGSAAARGSCDGPHPGTVSGPGQCEWPPATAHPTVRASARGAPGPHPALGAAHEPAARRAPSATVPTGVQRQLLWPLGDNYFGRFRCDLDRCREYGDGLTSLWTARAPSTGSSRSIEPSSEKALMGTVPYGTSLAKLGRFLAASSGGRSSTDPRQQGTRRTTAGRGWWWRRAAGPVRSIARHVELEHHGVVHQAVDCRSGGHLVAEDPVPLAEDQVAGHHHRAALCSTRRTSAPPIVTSAP